MLPPPTSISGQDSTWTFQRKTDSLVQSRNVGILLRSLEFLESRFFRGNKSHDLHCLVRSTLLQLVFLNLPFLPNHLLTDLGSPSVSPCRYQPCLAQPFPPGPGWSRASGISVSPPLNHSLLCTPLQSCRLISISSLRPPGQERPLLQGSCVCTQQTKDPLVTRHCLLRRKERNCKQ